MSEITFYEIDGVIIVVGETEGTIQYFGNAYGPIEVGSGVTEGTIFVRGEADLEQSTEIEDPELPVITDGTIYASAEILTFLGVGGEADGTLAVFGEAGFGFGADGTIVVLGEANENFEPTDDYIFIVEPYGLIVSYVGAYFDTMEDRLLFGTSQAYNEIAVMREFLALGASPQHALEASSRGTDQIEFSDVLRLIYRELITISLELGVTDVVDYRAIAIMVDRLLLSATVSTALEAHKLIVDALVLNDSIYNSWRDTMEDALLLSEAHTDILTAMGLMVDEALFGVVDQSVATLQVLVPDGVEFNAEQTSFAELASQLRDEINFVVRLEVDNFQYTAWTVNAGTTAHARYTNYPFNGFMQIGSKWYGTSEQGLYRLEGDTDHGTAIASKIRLGMSKLNNSNMKAVQSMYLGYKADGDMLVKVIVADDHTGKREAHVYKLVERGGGSQREGRVPIGRGLQSVYWDFEIENVDGADFELDTVEILPLIHERRVRGSSGGKA